MSESVRVVERMLDEIGEWTPLDEAADNLVQDIMSEIQAEACAVLVHDYEGWAVAGHKGLRPLETQLTVGKDAWIVKSTVGAKQVLNVENTDMVRAQLSYVPLASRRCLLVAPVPDVEVLVMAARQVREFGKNDVKAITRIAKDSTKELDQAIQLRDLARAFMR